MCRRWRIFWDYCCSTATRDYRARSQPNASESDGLTGAAIGLQQTLARMICEQVAIPDVAFQGGEAAVTRDVHHLEQACSASCSRGEESGAQRVSGELCGVEACAIGVGFDDQGD